MLTGVVPERVQRCRSMFTMGVIKCPSVHISERIIMAWPLVYALRTCNRAEYGLSGE
jgi:hypothetical protein